MPFNIKSTTEEEYHYARLLTWIATKSSKSDECDEPRQKRLRSNACSKLCANQLNRIISFCIDGRMVVVPEMWRLKRNMDVPVGARVQIIEPRVESAYSLGLVGVKTADWEAEVDVRPTSPEDRPTNFITCFNIEGMLLQDNVTIASALNMDQ